MDTNPATPAPLLTQVTSPLATAIPDTPMVQLTMTRSDAWTAAEAMRASGDVGMNELAEVIWDALVLY